MTLSLVGINAALVLALMTALWLASVKLRDVSIVDPWWSIGFLVVTVSSALVTGLSAPKLLVLGVVALWSLRLWAYLLRRSLGKPEDARYTAFRERFGRERYWWFSFFQVFLLQGALLFVISAPLQLAASAPAENPLSWTDVLGAALALFGTAFEAIGDAQLARFKADPNHRGKVCDTGLWRLTRHPNYFGEAVLAVGFWLFAVDEPWGVATVFAPALMIFLLLRVSGVSLLDAHLSKTKPGYAEYMRRTSAFFPRPPKA